jgi:hypothetical protein
MPSRHHWVDPGLELILGRSINQGYMTPDHDRSLFCLGLS